MHKAGNNVACRAWGSKEGNGEWEVMCNCGGTVVGECKAEKEKREGEPGEEIQALQSRGPARNGEEGNGAQRNKENEPKNKGAK